MFELVRPKNFSFGQQKEKTKSILTYTLYNKCDVLGIVIIQIFKWVEEKVYTSLEGYLWPVSDNNCLRL